MSTTPVKPTPETPAETVEQRFSRLAAAWHRDTDYLSSMEDSENHLAYQEIIRLGREVMPLLLRPRREPYPLVCRPRSNHWCAAGAHVGCR
jgi:hypothetical protein